MGYKEPIAPQKKKAAAVEDEPMMIDADVLPDAQKFSAFTGSGARLGGNKKKGAQKDAPVPVPLAPTKKQIDVATLGKGVPNYDWKPGRLTFRRNLRKSTASESDGGQASSFSAFSGAGFSLKKTQPGKA